MTIGEMLRLFMNDNKRNVEAFQLLFNYKHNHS